MCVCVSGKEGERRETKCRHWWIEMYTVSRALNFMAEFTYAGFIVVRVMYTYSALRSRSSQEEEGLVKSLYHTRIYRTD